MRPCHRDQRVTLYVEITSRSLRVIRNTSIHYDTNIQFLKVQGTNINLNYTLYSV